MTNSLEWTDHSCPCLHYYDGDWPFWIIKERGLRRLKHSRETHSPTLPGTESQGKSTWPHQCPSRNLSACLPSTHLFTQTSTCPSIHLLFDICPHIYSYLCWFISHHWFCMYISYARCWSKFWSITSEIHDIYPQTAPTYWKGNPQTLLTLNKVKMHVGFLTHCW